MDFCSAKREWTWWCLDGWRTKSWSVGAMWFLLRSSLFQHESSHCCSSTEMSPTSPTIRKQIWILKDYHVSLDFCGTCMTAHRVDMEKWNFEGWRLREKLRKLWSFPEIYVRNALKFVLQLDSACTDEEFTVLSGDSYSPWLHEASHE